MQYARHHASVSQKELLGYVKLKSPYKQIEKAVEVKIRTA